PRRCWTERSPNTRTSSPPPEPTIPPRIRPRPPRTARTPRQRAPTEPRAPAPRTTQPAPRPGPRPRADATAALGTTAAPGRRQHWGGRSTGAAAHRLGRLSTAPADVTARRPT